MVTPNVISVLIPTIFNFSQVGKSILDSFEENLNTLYTGKDMGQESILAPKEFSGNWVSWYCCNTESKTGAQEACCHKGSS